MLGLEVLGYGLVKQRTVGVALASKGAVGADSASVSNKPRNC